MLEAGDIKRFPKASNYSSYYRCVKSEKLPNKKKMWEGNRKNGNKYLAWAYVEAANFAVKYYSETQSFYQRKEAKRNSIVATKALGNKQDKGVDGFRPFALIQDDEGIDVDLGDVVLEFLGQTSCL